MSEVKVLHEWKSVTTQVPMRLEEDDVGQPWVAVLHPTRGWVYERSEQMGSVAAREELARLAARVRELEAAVHPWYGGCDAMGDDGGCAECQKISKWDWPKDTSLAEYATKATERIRELEAAVRWMGSLKIMEFYRDDIARFHPIIRSVIEGHGT